MQSRWDILREERKEKFVFDNKYWDNPQLYDSVILYQIGDVSCDKGFFIGDHIQNCYEISYIVSGKGDYYHRGHTYSVKTS